MKHLLAIALCLSASACIVDAGEGQDPYDTCDFTSDCNYPAGDCFRVTWSLGDGRMCSRYCEVDADCVGWASCYALDGDPTGQKICYARCVDDRDCNRAFQCATAERGGVPVDAICMPR